MQICQSMVITMVKGSTHVPRSCGFDSSYAKMYVFMTCVISREAGHVLKTSQTNKVPHVGVKRIRLEERA